MANSVLSRLVSLKNINSENIHIINKNLYRLLCRKELLIFAYNKVKAKYEVDTRH